MTYETDLKRIKEKRIRLEKECKLKQELLEEKEAYKEKLKERYGFLWWLHG